MEHDQQLRNLRDFLLVYNRMTETCFQRCTTNFNYRHLTMDEEHCVDSCAGKLIRSNHRLMGTYVRLMPGMVQRRMEELESKAAEAAKAAEGATAVEPQSLPSSSVLPPPPHPAEMPPAVPPVPDVMTPSAPMPVIEPFVPSNAERVGTDAEIPAVPPLATLGTPQALEATPTMPTILAPSTNGSPQTAPAILETVTKLAEADGPPVQSFSSDAIQPMPLPPVMDRPPVFLDQSPQLSSVAPTVAETSVTNSYPVLSPPTVSVTQQPADHASIAEPVHLTPAHPSNSSVSVSDMSKAVAAMPIEKLALPKQSDQASTTVTTTSQSAVVMGQDSQPPS